MTKKAVFASGYFDPIHPGHVKYLEEAAKLGDLFVIVNNDQQAELKKGKAFMPASDRLEVVKALSCVKDAKIAWDKDRTVELTICTWKIMLKYQDKYTKFFFAKGGDSTPTNVPERNICENLGIKIVWDVGGKKTHSSSEIVKNAK